MARILPTLPLLPTPVDSRGQTTDPVCGLCGARLGNVKVHTEWHFPPDPTCSASGCSRYDGLKMCGPLGERCPDHFVEP